MRRLFYILLSSTAGLASPESLQSEFQSTVRPVLERFCSDCHASDEPKGDRFLVVSEVMPLTRMIGQPQNCRMCDRAPVPEDDGSTQPELVP